MNKLPPILYGKSLITCNATFVCGLGYQQAILLLAERALSRDYPCKMWSSETLYLTASRAGAIIHYSLLHVK